MAMRQINPINLSNQQKKICHELTQIYTNYKFKISDNSCKFASNILMAFYHLLNQLNQPNYQLPITHPLPSELRKKGGTSPAVCYNQNNVSRLSDSPTGISLIN